MRRIAAVAITGATLMGGLALTTPANAATTSGTGVKQTVVQQTYSANAATAGARASACRTITLTEGYRSAKDKKGHWHWLFYVKNSMKWCYNGSQVTSAKATYTWYTHARKTYQWKGWVTKSLKHSSTRTTETSKAKGKFYYWYSKKHHRTYKPYVNITGHANGSYTYKYGG